MNYRDLLNKIYILKFYFLLIIVIITSLIIYLSNKKITNIFNTLGYCDDNKIVFNIPIKYSDTLNKLVYVKINNSYYYLSDLIISDIILDKENLVNYQEIIININEVLNENMLIPITIYYNEEKVFTKIKNLLL